MREGGARCEPHHPAAARAGRYVRWWRAGRRCGTPPWPSPAVIARGGAQGVGAGVSARAGSGAVNGARCGSENTARVGSRARTCAAAGGQGERQRRHGSQVSPPPIPGCCCCVSPPAGVCGTQLGCAAWRAAHPSARAAHRSQRAHSRHRRAPLTPRPLSPRAPPQASLTHLHHAYAAPTHTLRSATPPATPRHHSTPRHGHAALLARGVCGPGRHGHR